MSSGPSRLHIVHNLIHLLRQFKPLWPLHVRTVFVITNTQHFAHTVYACFFFFNVFADRASQYIS